MFAINTNWPFFYDTVDQKYFLLDQDSWLTATDTKGPWTPAPTLPDSLASLPDDENWADVRSHVPGKKFDTVPSVFVTTKPTELILTDGDPTYTPIPGTRLLSVGNSNCALFRDTADNKFYFLAAGRWFRATSLEGPWSAASDDLPADFAKIPDDNADAFVKASVPGTQDAKDAVMLASVPTTNTVDLANPVTVSVEYHGDPQFKDIDGTSVRYAVNSAYTVLLVNGNYYCCDQGVWFTSNAATGPWSYCTKVPPAIYTIPPSSPVYNVTYVTVESSTPETVIYSQTAGYSGEYVAANGVLMFGAGLLAGAIIADNHNDYYYPRPAFYSYGCGAVYHHGYGGYYGGARAAYGPYGGIGYGAAYNPATGVYSRGARAYGPHGSAGVRQAYNPYTGTYAAAGYRATPRGTATAGRAYNPYTGASAAGGRVSTAYGSAARGAAYNPRTGNAVAGASRSGPAGSAGVVRTNRGTGAAAWNNPYSQGAVAKTKSGNIYGAKDGTVYKRDSNGWSENSGNGWKAPAKPRPTQLPANATSSGFNRERFESQARARDRGSFQSQRTSSWRSSERFSGGDSRRGGRGRRR